MSEDIDQKLLQRFEIIQKIRKVSSGIIWKAIDRKTKGLVAIKKTDYSAHPLHLLKSLRETVILQEISKHPNVLKVLQVINKGTDQYIVYDFVEMDLISLIRVKVLQPQHIQVLLCNIVTTLFFIHSGGMVHLNLTPSKILVDQECQIKLIGFGFAQVMPVKNPKFTCLHYLSPEILLQGKVTAAADIWSLGCIFGEMLCYHTLFTGTSALNQVEKIVELIGKPSDSNLSEMAPYVLQGIQTDKKKSFSSITNDSTAIDLLKKMLTFEPNQRITLLEILKHPYLSEFASKCELKKPIQQFQIEDSSLKEFQNIVRERSKKVEPPSINASFTQQLDTSRRKSFKESTPMSALRQKTSLKAKVNSPVQSPKIQKLYQIDEKSR